jgi:hypothetical protein
MKPILDPQVSKHFLDFNYIKNNINNKKKKSEKNQ